MMTGASRRPSHSETVSHLERELRGDLSALQVLESAARILLRAVPADVWCGVILDPSTLLDTGGFHEFGFPESTLHRLFEIEHLEQDDVDHLRALVRRPVPVSLLSESTRGRLETSKYFREILRPLDLADELRVLLRDGNRTWGLLVLCRHGDSRRFDAADLAVATELAGLAASALRRALLLAGRDLVRLPDSTGLLILDAGFGIRHSTPTADHWLDQVQEHSPRRADGCPYVFRALASQAWSSARIGGTPTRIPTRSGRWISARAWPGPRTGERLTTIAINPTDPDQLTPLIFDAYGLTDRQRVYAQELITGRSIAEMAARHHLSAYTLQEQLRGVYEKVRVNNRKELVYQIFARHHLPRLADPDLTTDGRLLDDRSADGLPPTG